MNCTTCGAPPGPDDRACRFCGTALPYGGARQAPSAPVAGDDDILRLIREDKLIEAIKVYRDRYRSSLVDAKNAIDAMRARSK